jgi:BTB/POZ domain-containing protein KCTD9
MIWNEKFKEFFTKIKKANDYIVERPLLTTLIVFFFILTPLISLSVVYKIYGAADFAEQILIQAHGMVFDIGVIGILLYWLNQNGERIREIRHHVSEIDDFRTWLSEESAFRTVGNIKRLNRHKIYNIDLVNCHLPNTNLSHTNLTSSNINSANLSKTTMIETNLENTRLNQTNFQESNLNHANLKGAYANAANFDHAFLIKSNFENAFLIKTSFKNAFLMEANLKNTYLMGADFENASLYKADFRGSKGLTVQQLAKAKTLYLAQFDADLMKQLADQNLITGDSVV